MADVELIAAYSGGSNDGGTGPTVSVLNVVAGDSLIAAIGDGYGDATMTVTDSAAGTWADLGTPLGAPNDPLFQNYRAHTQRREITADAAALDVTYEIANSRQLVVLHLRNAGALQDLADLVDDQGGGGPADTQALGPVDGTSGGLLIGLWGGVQFSTGTWGWSTPTGMVERADVASPEGFTRLMVATEALTATAATGTRSSTATQAPANGFAGRLLSILPGPAGVPYLPGALDAGRLAVEFAPGADTLGSAPDTWPWTDITTDVRTESMIITTLGRGDEASVSQPASLALVLHNEGSAYSLTGHGEYWPYIRQGTPVRVTIDPGDGDPRIVLLGFAAQWVPSWDALVGLPVVTLVAAGTLRRLGQGQAPVASALRRALTETASVVAYWPMEDGADSTRLRAVRGGRDMTYTGDPKLGSVGDVFNCSAPIADAGSGAFTADVDLYDESAGTSQVRFLVRVPDDGLDDGTVLAYIWTAGSLLRWDIVYGSLGTGVLSVYIYNANGTLNDSVINIGFDMNGKDRRLSFELRQVGADVEWTLGVIQPSDLGAGEFGDTVTTDTFGRVTQVQLAPLGGCDGVVLGHLSVQDEITSLYEATGALTAHVGEFATSSTVSVSRMHRLCSENGLQLDRVNPGGGSLTFGDAMGPQLVGTLLDLLRECETADQGQFWDGRHGGLTYTTRRYRETPAGAVQLTIDAAAGELAPPWTPTHDDQRIRNDVTATQLQGITDRVVDVDGDRGTAIVGTYDSSLTVNVKLGEMAHQHAGWQVALGTQATYRFPTVSVDLVASPHLAADVLDVVPGGRIDVVNLVDVLPTFPPEPVRLIVEGISHAIGPATWVVTFQCSPWSPWGVAEFAAATGDTSDMVWRADTSASEMAATAAFGATSISVATTAGPLWTTVADDYPLHLEIGGVRVRATACSGASSPQTMTVDALTGARGAGSPVRLWDPRPIGL